MGNKPGRPTKYKKEYNELCFKLALLGCCDSEMADVIGISESTFNEWKKSKSGFSESINNGKDKADAEVINSLYQRALGVTVKEEVVIEDKNGKQISKRITSKELPADTKAAQIWVTNRQRRKWRQNPDNFNDDGTQKESSITIQIGKNSEPLPNKESDIIDFTEDE